MNEVNPIKLLFEGMEKLGYDNFIVSIYNYFRYNYFLSDIISISI